MRSAQAPAIDTARGSRPARGWALALGIMHLLHSADGPHHEKIGRHAIAAVLDDLGYSTSEE